MRKTALHALLAAVSAAALCGAASAQQALPPMPGPAVGLPPIAMPAQNIAGPARPMQAKPAESAGAAEMPVQPPGGMLVNQPRPDAADATARMNLDGARSYSAKLQGDGQAALTGMTARNLEQTPVAQLPSAAIQGEGDLQSLVKSQRNIRVLNQQVEEAKKAVELWHVLYNNEDAKQWREKEEKVLEVRKKEEEDTRKREQQAAAQAAQQQAQAQAAMGGMSSLVNGGGAIASALASPPPVAPKVVEVSGSQALLLVPGKGEVWGRVGTSLNGSYRVLSVAPKKVEVMGPKGREVLAFGTSVTGPANPPGQQARPPQQMQSLPAPRL